MEEKTTIEKPEMNISSIRNLLWDEIYNLKDGNTSAANLGAITNATGKILATVVMQMKYAELTGQKVDKISGMVPFITDESRLIEAK